MRRAILPMLGMVACSGAPPATPIAGDAPRGEERPVGDLEAGAAQEGEVPAVAGSFVAYRFRVSDDIVHATVDLRGRADVDLYVTRKIPEDVTSLGVDAQVSAEDMATERIELSRDQALETGDYFALVVFQRDAPPTDAHGNALERIAFEIEVNLVPTRVDCKLIAGQPIAGNVAPERGRFHTCTIDVPKDAPVLRLDLTDSPGDLDLRARKGAPIRESDDADWHAGTSLGTEVLVIPADGEDIAGTWYVDVFDKTMVDFAVPFRLRASFEEGPNAELLALPAMPKPATPLERAVYSTVEIIDDDDGGSGVVISELGYILTNYHVVQAKAESRGQVGVPLAVAVTLDPRDPPREAFRARIVAAEPSLDLALLKCESGLYGQPIPPGYRFVAAAIGRPEDARLGDSLALVGYPSVGGSGSRAPVTLTRGGIAGFDRRGDTLHIKTDASIGQGSSGGGAFDASYKLIGLPTEAIEVDLDKLAYIRPIWLVPAGWWVQAGI